jgi:hypothetical protein
MRSLMSGLSLSAVLPFAVGLPQTRFDGRNHLDCAAAAAATQTLLSKCKVFDDACFLFG